MASASSSAAPSLHYRLCEEIDTEYRDLVLRTLSFPGEFSHRYGETSGWRLHKQGGLLNKYHVQPLVVPMLVAEIDRSREIAPQKKLV